jgi:hypothetical protein
MPLIMPKIRENPMKKRPAITNQCGTKGVRRGFSPFAFV